MAEPQPITELTMNGALTAHAGTTRQHQPVLEVIGARRGFRRKCTVDGILNGLHFKSVQILRLVDNAGRTGLGPAFDSVGDYRTGGEWQLCWRA